MLHRDPQTAPVLLAAFFHPEPTMVAKPALQRRTLLKREPASGPGWVASASRRVEATSRANTEAEDRRSGGPGISRLGALLADPSRAAILLALMDGRSQTAKELAYRAAVSPSTASEHLAKLERRGLIARLRQGRNHYFHLAD